MRERYTVGELAELSGVSARCLRFYEEAGLLVPARDPANGYRRYAASDVERLREILLLRRLATRRHRRAHIAGQLGGGPI